MAKSEHRVNVYVGKHKEEIIARVRYTDNLDYWNGSNWQNGGTGMHKGLTKLKDGRYVIVIGSQWQGARDYAYVVSAEEAVQEILKSGNAGLLDTDRFRELKAVRQEMLVEEDEGDEGD